MRQLTFKGFTKTYVSSLSKTNSTAIYALAREAADENPRLIEPLFLYAVSNGIVHTLLSASKSTVLYDSYSRMASAYSYNELIEAFEAKDDSLPEEYHKVWGSYKSVSKKHERDDRVKALMRIKILELQETKKVSTYRICEDIGFNKANVNAWLKHGTSGKMKLDNARKILKYLEND